MPAVPEVITITAPSDPCGYVFAPANKAAGGTFLEWSHYRLCQVTHALVNGPAQLWHWFSGEVSAAWTWLKNLWNAGVHGLSLQAQRLWSKVQDLAKRIQDALDKLAPKLELILVGVVAVGALLVFNWVTR